MKRAPKIRDLRAKVDLLIQSQPVFLTDKSIATYLGISPSALSVFINGSSSRLPELLPCRHVYKMLLLYGLNSSMTHVFTDYSINEFRSTVKKIPIL